MTESILKDKEDFDGFDTHRTPDLETDKSLLGQPRKQKSMMSFKTETNLSWGILVYKVEKSKVEMDFARDFLLILLN